MGIAQERRTRRYLMLGQLEGLHCCNGYEYLQFEETHCSGELMDALTVVMLLCVVYRSNPMAVVDNSERGAASG